MTATAKTTRQTDCTWHVIDSEMLQLDAADTFGENQIKNYFRIDGWIHEAWFTAARAGQAAELVTVPVEYPRSPFEAAWPHRPVQDGDKFTVWHNGEASRFVARMKWGAMEFDPIGSSGR